MAPVVYESELHLSADDGAGKWFRKKAKHYAGTEETLVVPFWFPAQWTTCPGGTLNSTLQWSSRSCYFPPPPRGAGVVLLRVSLLKWTGGVVQNALERHVRVMTGEEPPSGKGNAAGRKTLHAEPRKAFFGRDRLSWRIVINTSGSQKTACHGVTRLL